MFANSLANATHWSHARDHQLNKKHFSRSGFTVFFSFVCVEEIAMRIKYGTNLNRSFVRMSVWTTSSHCDQCWPGEDDADGIDNAIVRLSSYSYCRRTIADNNLECH